MGCQCIHRRFLCGRTRSASPKLFGPNRASRNVSGRSWAASRAPICATGGWIGRRRRCSIRTPRWTRSPRRSVTGLRKPSAAPSKGGSAHRHRRGDWPAQASRRRNGCGLRRSALAKGAKRDPLVRASARPAGCPPVRTPRAGRARSGCRAGGFSSAPRLRPRP